MTTSELRRRTDAANGLLAALNVFMPLLTDLDVNELLKGRTDWRITSA